MDEKLYLGAGLKFPPQVNKATGRFVLSSKEESVKESIYLILMTQRTERFARPGYGSNLMSYTFMDTNITALNMMKRDLTEQILTQEPRVGDVEITTDTQTKDGCLIVTIDYVVSETNQRDNLVFPFYLNAEVEEEAYEPEQYESEQYDSEREQDEQ